MRVFKQALRDGLRFASDLVPTSPRLSSSHPELDRYLGGGIPFGDLSEWGMPMGSGGRALIRGFVKEASLQQMSILWVSSHELLPYPPAWQAEGVDLGQVFFARSADPIHDLRAVFRSSFFKMLVFDQPVGFFAEQLAFLAERARHYEQVVCILRPYALSHERGNVWAKWRFNLQGSKLVALRGASGIFCI